MSVSPRKGLKPSPPPYEPRVAGRWPVGRPIRLVLPAEPHRALIELAGADHSDPETVIIKLILDERRRRRGPWPRA